MRLWFLGTFLVCVLSDELYEVLRETHEVARRVAESAKAGEHIRALASLPQSVEESLKSLQRQTAEIGELLGVMEGKLSAKEENSGINITLVEQQLEQLTNLTKRMHGLEDHLWDVTSPKLEAKVDKGLDYQLATKEYLQEGLELVLRETEALDQKVRRENQFMWVYSLLGLTATVVLWSVVVLLRAVKA